MFFFSSQFPGWSPLRWPPGPCCLRSSPRGCFVSWSPPARPPWGPWGRPFFGPGRQGKRVGKRWPNTGLITVKTSILYYFMGLIWDGSLVHINVENMGCRPLSQVTKSVRLDDVGTLCLCAVLICFAFGKRLQSCCTMGVPCRCGNDSCRESVIHNWFRHLFMWMTSIKASAKRDYKGDHGY